MSDTLVVVSRVRSHIHVKKNFRTSAKATNELSTIVEGLCDAAVLLAEADNRMTVLDRDIIKAAEMGLNQGGEIE